MGKEFIAKKMLYVAINTILGAWAFYMAVICPVEAYPLYIFMSVTSFCFAVNSAWKIRVFKLALRERKKSSFDNYRKAVDKALARSKADAPVEYEDKGQEYRFIVHVGGNMVTCYSKDSYLGTEGQLKLIGILEKDGKISLGKDMQIVIEVQKRVGTKFADL